MEEKSPLEMEMGQESLKIYIILKATLICGYAYNYFCLLLDNASLIKVLETGKVNNFAL